MRFGNPISSINTSQPQQLLGQISWNKANDASTSFTLPAAAQSLMLLLSSPGSSGSPGIGLPAQVIVTGNTTGIIYFDQVIATEDWSFAPISPVTDASVTIKCVGQGGLPINPPDSLIVVARLDPAIVAIAGVEPGYETNRFQPVIPSTPGSISSAYIQIVSPTTGGTLLAPLTVPPVYPNRYRLWSLFLSVRSGAAGSLCIGQIVESSSGNILLNVMQFGADQQSLYLGGLILPANGGLTIGSSAATQLFAGVTYDLMSVG